MNQRLIPERLSHIEGIMQSYRKHYLEETRAKSNVLTYRFFTNVYNMPRDPTRLAESSITHEKDIRVRQLMLGCEKALQTTYDRLSAVTRLRLRRGGISSGLVQQHGI
jgi:predicted secreted protein